MQTLIFFHLFHSFTLVIFYIVQQGRNSTLKATNLLCSSWLHHTDSLSSFGLFLSLALSIWAVFYWLAMRSHNDPSTIVGWTISFFKKYMYLQIQPYIRLIGYLGESLPPLYRILNLPRPVKQDWKGFQSIRLRQNLLS